MPPSYFQDLLTTITERGRALLDYGPATASIEPEDDCRRLLSGQGEASGVAIAQRLLSAYADRDDSGKTEFFRMLAEHFAPDREALQQALNAYLDDPSPEAYRRLCQASEAPRQELFRRLNQAPGGTAALVALRSDLLGRLREQPELAAVDYDLAHLFNSWFNRGFLVLRRIDWSTPANILEKIIRYEAVHEIRDWDELRRRLVPVDRRCFAFFHPALVDEPLIFVEVALTEQIPGSIQAILSDAQPLDDAGRARTAVFYSISNCQEGLRGISLGNFLIKQVVEELSRDLSGLKHFVTLSPVPGFMCWLREAVSAVPERERERLARLNDPHWPDDAETVAALKDILLPLAGYYFLEARRDDGQPVDAVARFHLGNGALLEQINWLADVSPKGLEQAAGLMVNYRYDLDQIEANHEQFVNQGTVVASSAVRKLLRTYQKRQAKAES